MTPRPDRRPVRTCVGCRLTGGKGELVRLVRATAGGAAIDPGGRAPGRGAYLHRDPACWTAALRRGALSRALRTSLGPEEAGRLLAELEGATTE